MVLDRKPIENRSYRGAIFAKRFSYPKELKTDIREDMELAVGIVDDLNLNTRIWDKQ